MSIILKSFSEIEKIKKAGKITAEILNVLKSNVAPGITTFDLEEIAIDEIKKHSVLSAFLKYNGFPANLCVSVNEEIIHGIPSKEKILSEGDIIGLDLGIICDGYFGDAAITIPVGKVALEAEKLIETTEKTLDLAISAIRPRIKLGVISAIIETGANYAGYSVIEDYGGHGIGRTLHEPPFIPNYVHRRFSNLILEPGLVFTIEPMFCFGSNKIQLKQNNWTVITKDGGWSAHFEHMIAITEDKIEILTKL